MDRSSFLVCHGWEAPVKPACQGDPTDIWNTSGMALQFQSQHAAARVWQPIDGWCGSLIGKRTQAAAVRAPILTTRPPGVQTPIQGKKIPMTTQQSSVQLYLER